MKTNLSNVLTQNYIDETWQGRAKDRSIKNRCDKKSSIKRKEEEIFGMST